MSAPCSPTFGPRRLAMQHGAGAIEFVIAALPVLFLGLGSIEVAHWFHTRQAISLALLDAGRAAITDHNRAERIIRGFEQALRPLYASPDPGTTRRRLLGALTRRQQNMHDAPWQIRVLSPSFSAFQDFSDAGLRIAGAAGLPAINNHYLAEQHQYHRQQGWPDGRGPVSGQTIFEANTVVLRLVWLHEPSLPLISPILRAVGDPGGNYRRRALAKGYLPMTRQIVLLMQSHPVYWKNDPQGKVIYRMPDTDSDGPCRGWLCGQPGVRQDDQASPPPDRPPTVPGATRPGGPGSGHPDHTRDPAVNPDPSRLVPPESGLPDLAVDPDDPACGVTLCCA